MLVGQRSIGGFLKEGSTLCLKGSVEVDDYRTNDIGALMFRMRVKEVSTIDEELKRKISSIEIDVRKSDSLSLENFGDKLELIDPKFWSDGSCKINFKVQSNNSEAIIELGDEYKFVPNIENLFYLEDLFGKDTLKV